MLILLVFMSMLCHCYSSFHSCLIDWHWSYINDVCTSMMWGWDRGTRWRLRMDDGHHLGHDIVSTMRRLRGFFPCHWWLWRTRGTDVSESCSHALCKIFTPHLRALLCAPCVWCLMWLYSITVACAKICICKASGLVPRSQFFMIKLFNVNKNSI